MVRSLSRDRSGMSNLAAFAVLILAIALILGVYYVYLVPQAAPEPLRAQERDSVTVEYVGTFENSELVFDTSVITVAQDNASYPKAFSFGWRDRWQPLQFAVGDGSMIRGFDQGVRGLAVGESRTLVVPYADGYGAADPSKISTRRLLESVPVRLTMNATHFLATYRTSAVSGINVTDLVGGCTAVVSVAGSIVTVMNSPVPDQAIRPYNLWDATVVSIDDSANGGVGEILVQHRLDPTMIDRIGGKVDGQDFFLSDVDLIEGSYTLDFNRQVAGRSLLFQVTLKTLLRP